MFPKLQPLQSKLYCLLIYFEINPFFLQFEGFSMTYIIEESDGSRL